MSFFGSRNSILVFTILTALIHLGLGFRYFSEPDFLGELFILNGIGYLSLMYAYLWTPSFLSDQKALVRWVYVGFTAVTIVLFFVINADPFRAIPGLVDKLIEVLLVVSLLRHSS